MGDWDEQKPEAAKKERCPKRYAIRTQRAYNHWMVEHCAKLTKREEEKAIQKTIEEHQRRSTSQAGGMVVIDDRNPSAMSELGATLLTSVAPKKKLESIKTRLGPNE